MADRSEHDARPDTAGRGYTDRLVRKQFVRWKHWLRVQAPYRWNLRRLNQGFLLDIGCGIGRNLLHLDGHGVGVDHNEESVRLCRRRGLEAYTPTEFWNLASERDWLFDSILLAHVLEHMTFEEAVGLVSRYLPLLRSNGRAIFITPQERGFRAEPSHVEFFDFARLRLLAEALGLTLVEEYSFPFPRRPFGELFKYNEFVAVAQRGHVRSSERRVCPPFE